MLVPEKDSTTSEAQKGVLLDDPEGAGRPTGQDSVQYGRVTTSCSSSLHPQLAPSPGAQDLPPATALGARVETHLY